MFMHVAAVGRRSRSASASAELDPPSSPLCTQNAGARSARPRPACLGTR